MLPVPPNVARVDRDVEQFDSKQVFVKDGKLVPFFNNVRGEVEHVLSDYHAIIKFKPEDDAKFYRVLCSSEDVFHLEFPKRLTTENFAEINPYKFTSAKVCWDMTAKEKGLSLLGIMKVGMEVKLNAVALLSNYPNPAEVHYCTAGVLVGPNALNAAVPVECLTGLWSMKADFKKRFMVAIRSLNSDGECAMGATIQRNKKFKKIQEGWKKGKIGLFITLRQEYQSPVDIVDVVDDEDQNSGQEGEDLDLEGEDMDKEDEDTDYITIPPSISKVCKDVEKVDKTKIHMEGDKIVPLFADIEGEVEKVLTDHIAVVRFQPTLKSAWYRAIATSDDVFHFDFNSDIDEANFGKSNPHKFQSAILCWNLSAKRKKISLHGILKPRQKVKMNVLPLVSDLQNEAEVFYSTAGVLVGANSLSCPVPFEIKDPENIVFSSEFKLGVFSKIIRSLNKDADAIHTLETPTCGLTKKNCRTGPIGRLLTLRREYLHKKQWPKESPPKAEASFINKSTGRLSKNKDKSNTDNAPPNWPEQISPKVSAPLKNNSNEDRCNKDKSPLSNKPSLKHKSSFGKSSATKSEEVKSSFVLPEPVASIKKSRPLEDIMNKCEGRVLKVVDRNYAIGVSAEPDFQFLFDTVDIYIGETECRKLGKLLGDVLTVGDFIKFNAVRVKGEETETSWAEGRNVKYMATAVVFAKTKEELGALEIPGSVPEILSAEEVSPDKINNFKIVANVINKIKLSKQEKDLLKEPREQEASNQDKSKGTQHDVVDLSDDDDDVQVLAAQHEIDEILKDVNGRELRKIIMSYMELLNGLEGNLKNKINVKQILTVAKIEKDQVFVRKLLMALGKICQRSPKGVKIGHIFVTPAQAKTIVAKGSLSENDYIIQEVE